jgi:uncharacterized pyridoxamine 5'-phosphate oxidase family protein
MKEIINFLEQNKFGNLATSTDGQPYVRPFEYGFKTDDGVFFYTSDDKAVYSQLQSNPKASFCATDENLTYVQLTGDVKFTDDKKYKDMMIQNSRNASKIYQSADNPQFKVFYMPHGHAMMHKHEGGYVCDENF